MPEYKGLVGYLDPSSAFVGYVGAVAINEALGGNMDNFDPAINWFKALQQNNPIVPKQTAYARLISGEIPILLDYDFSAYRAQYKDGEDVAFVIPQEGTSVVPCVVSLVRNAAHAEEGRRVLDFVLCEQGQAVWPNALLRPIRSSAISEQAQSRFLPDSDYARAKAVDYARMAQGQKPFAERYLAEVR